MVHNISDPAARAMASEAARFSGLAVASPSPTSGRPAGTSNNFAISAGPTPVDAVSAGGCGGVQGLGTHLITATKPE